jgi:vacuolar-type H+-ATPase subunit I/STV1
MIHILTGLIIKFYMLWRSGKKIDAICDMGFWIVALVGICAFAGGMAGISILNTVGIGLMVVGFGENLQDAHDKALAAVESIECDNLFYRRDIGWRVL